MSTQPATRPESPGSSTIKGTSNNNPADFDSDLAALAMVKDLLKGLDTPSDISKQFAARKALYTALNHTETNKTGYDASLRILLYSTYEKSSLNVQAKLFNSFMAFLMKPKMIIQGIPQGQQAADEPGFVQRAIGRLTGKGQPAQPNGGQQ